MQKTLWCFFLMIFYCSSFLFAGITGKIAGKVTDAETGAALPGVNVIIDGTSWGAASSVEGEYAIINIPPGTYSVKFSMMGYEGYRVTEVRVMIDITSSVSAKLKPATLMGEEVVVVSERPLVVPDISNSQMNIQGNKIDALPVLRIERVLTLQAGIETGSEGILVRGGSANQTAFMVDGLSMNDERSNIPYQAVSLSSIKEIQIQTGGFNAEYGNVRSGLVNVVTKEGQERYSATINFNYRPPRSKHFGNSLYDPYSYFNRSYLDPEVCWVGTPNGGWDDYTKRQYPQFEGWNAVSERLMQDRNPNNDLTPTAARRLYEWEHRRRGDIDKPDYVFDAGAGGPIPGIDDMLGNLRFYLTHYREQTMFIFPMARDNYGENHTQLKLTTDLSPSMKLMFTGLYGEVHSVSPYAWTTAPTGRILSNNSEVADLLNSREGNSMLYMPGYYSPSSVYRNVFSLKFTHVLGVNTFYEMSLQKKTSRYHTYQMALRDTTTRFEPVPGYLVDEAPYGYWGYSTSGIDGMSMGGWMNLGRDKSVNATTSFSIDLTSQVNARHQLKTGLNIDYNDFDINAGTESPSMSTWTRSMTYRIFPYRIGAYVQDKMEIRGFIANVGVRQDYSSPNSQKYVLTTYDKNLSAGYGNALDANVERDDTKARWSFAPRLGVSHPITEDSKLYFNYGHFRAEPASTYRFRLQRESSGMVTDLGNPELEMEKTVAYELGYEHNLYDQFSVTLAGYYKDITNQIGWILYRNMNNSVQYSQTANNNYQDIRGFELTITKQTGRWITGFVNYTYDVSTSGYFGLREYYEDPNKQREYLRLNPYESKPEPRPYARASIDMHTPADFGPSTMGINPLSHWNLNILANWKTGSYYTFNPNKIPGVINDTQWKNYYNIDLRFSKLFKVNQLEFQFYLDITNVLNTKRLNYAGFANNYDWLDYMNSLNFSWEEGDHKGDDRIGNYRPDDVAYDPLEPNPNNDPAITARNNARKEKKSYIDMPNIKELTFLNPRDIILGLRINF